MRPVVSQDNVPAWARVQDAEAPPLGTWKLAVVSDPQLQLGVGEQAVVRVRATDADDQPAVGLRLSFALIGQPMDSGLSALDATTDEDGVAENTLIAGVMAVSFALRISTPGADPAQVEVAVSGEGFGAVEVSAPYSGRRDVTHRVVSAQTGVSCDAPNQGMTFVPSRPIERGDSATIDLPAGITYTVTAIAVSESQVIVAHACVDGVRVRANQTTEVDVSFADAAFKPVGQFSVKAELAATEPAASMAQTLEDAAELMVETNSMAQRVTENAEARFMLDSLDQTLHTPAYAERAEMMALATALTQARADEEGTSPETSLQQALDGFSTGPLVAIPRVATVARTSLEALTLFSALTLDPSNSKEPFAWQARRIQARPTIAGGNPPSVDLARLRLVANVDANFIPGKDRLEMTSVRLRANLGALASEVLPRALSSVAEGDTEHPDPFGCMTFGLWLSQQDEINGDVCDSDCVRATCDRAIERISTAAQSALDALDDARPDLQLHGTFKLEDDNGDLLADSMASAAFDGSWLSADDDEDDDDAVTGSAAATAITEASQLP